jgi:nicotinate-nucleotide adenylyltransferase
MQKAHSASGHDEWDGADHVRRDRPALLSFDQPIPEESMRIGIFGGTFDPVHFGHLLLAECCREQCRLDEVWFIPAATPPHKRRRATTPARQRVEMLELAIAGQDGLSIKTTEVDRGGVSYTVETLAAVHQQRPDAELFIIMGADSLADLPNWLEPRRICELALPVIVGRPGSPPPDDGPLAELVSPGRLAEIRRHRVEMPLIELSSTEIRRRVAAGMSIRYRTPRAVEAYIANHGLYRDATVD